MLDIISESFFINGVFAILIASIVTAPLGSMMVWNRLSYMGDSIAHSSLLGVGVATVLQMDASFTVLAVALILAVIISFVIDKVHSIDTVLNIMTSVVMSVGMVLLSFIPSSGERIIHSLFGDILMISSGELVQMLCISLVGVCVIIYRWKYWVSVSISYDLFLSTGISPRRIKMEILIMSALAVVLFSRSVGILLITAFLIIPASGARLLSRTPAQMVMVSMALSVISGIVGLMLSVRFDTFPGPMTIITSFFLLVLAHVLSKK
ncbi:metal ABC transporter permease [Anaplasma phagocytophilum str. Norway variant1]|uniref:High-affinity zinc uptake system membrane protein ZnuB n=1 Tax=Anaplasma phagocytophilum str. Norway variant1 TaxID=1392506 RepID=A0A7H9DYF1_ANAPH|nr:metal ABC transporter permease [Anaplasma phagocytophilum]QLL66603.1 metal ABC transporter permease [Anaplasma phagocytophilum str. Norway variant1]